MVTDTARVKLELASGRNEITAPFQYTAERKRKKPEEATATIAVAPATATDAPAEPPPAAQVIVDVPLAEATSPSAASLPLNESLPIMERPVVARPPWMAFIAAVLAVAGAVWWVMFQRMPDLDPQEIIQRNLVDAQQAMADGRYTDPAERSALHYYSTVLALDPANADAVAGIDTIADRHLTDARVLLADQRVAEAGVALDKARRVRPDHNGLAALDQQWRVELKKMLIGSAAPASPTESQQALAASAVPPPARTAVARRSSEAAREPAPQALRPAVIPPVASESPARATAADPPMQPAATLANASEALTALENMANAVAASPASTDSPAGAGANIDNSSIDDTAASAALPERTPATAVPAVEPKLIKMVQPEYPQEALMRGVEGWVEVSLQVTPAGDVVDPRIEATSRGRLFNRAALTAVQQWQYEPRGAGATTERLRVRLQFRRSN